jgi:hypothetical protein
MSSGSIPSWSASLPDARATARAPNCYPPAVRRVTILTLVLLVVFTAAACTGASTPSSAPPDDTFPLDTPPIDQTDEPTTEPEPEESFPTEPPLVTSEPEESFPTEPPLITSPPGSAIPAEACSESTDVQNFYATVVSRVDWDVYCPGLPTGWRIQTGNYDVSGVGYFVISYTNRTGSRLELSEGSFCGAPTGCAYDGEDAGAASFGDLAGTLFAGSDGSWTIVADPGAGASYMLIGRSIDEATFRELAVNMARVER